MQPLRSILGKFAKDFGLEGGAVLNAIRKKWVDIVGQPISIHTFPDVIKAKILTLIVDTPQWMHHLSFFKEELSEKLKPYNVDGIRFRLGKLPRTVKEVHDEAELTLTDEDLRYVENTVKNIKDEELKEKFRALIMHGLAKRKKED
ncbi:MAG: DUF721 domain-containing protein [Thermodesulfovibrionia bacterium]|nr:DUF721 domain-containing protein [Thermodesulfovibrionia bacterium]